ncbi:MAG: hypothetical protein AAFX65_07960 [Cyanobacteria bacterium J06638_7]
MNGGESLDVIRYRNFAKPKLLESLSLRGSANSVAVNDDGLIAVATAFGPKNRGLVEFFKIREDGSIRSKGRLRVGNLPDSLAFTPSGDQLVVANEGEPNQFFGTEDGRDPQGSIAILRINSRKPGQSRLTKLDFTEFSTKKLRNKDVRISGLKGTTPGTDIEPENVAVTDDGRRAFVTLQESNAIAEVNLANRTIKRIFSAGEQNYRRAGIFDTSDEDGGFQPGIRRFFGLMMPDGLDTFEQDGKQYIITANEGDGRVRPDDVNFKAPVDGTYFYGTRKVGHIFARFEDPLTGRKVFVTDNPHGARGSFDAEAEDEFFITLKYGAESDDGFYSDEIRAGDLRNPRNNRIVSGADEGRLKTIADANTKRRLVAFGGRSFTIYDAVTGETVYDSGDRLDRIVNRLGLYDDGRSDDKSIEPEAVTTARLGGRTFAFVGLERPTESVITAFDVSNPERPRLETVFNSPGSLSPEGLTFVKTGSRAGVLLVSNEVSGTLDSFAFAV